MTSNPWTCVQCGRTEPREEKHVLPGGATRSEKAPPYHLIPREGQQRTARRFGLGAKKHGDWNWLKSLTCEADAAVFAYEAYNHGMQHMLKMAIDDDPEDDHLGAIGFMQAVLSNVEAVYGKPWTKLDRTKTEVTKKVERT